jgi:hypothetical protein
VQCNLPIELTLHLSMTRIKRMKQVRRKPGPKPKPATEKVVKKTVSLQPATYQGLLKMGDGVLSRGIETVFDTVEGRKRTSA